MNYRYFLCFTTMSNFTDTPSPEPLVFSKEFNTLRIFIYHLWLCILIFGLVSNTTNILVFGKIGFRDNVTVTLLFLSLSDLLNLIFNCPAIVSRFVLKHYPNHDWLFDPRILTTGFFWYAYIFYDYSSFISVFLALVRCFCVARPLRFKSMFTISRTVIILVVLFLVALTLRAPVLTIFSFTWAVNPMTNATHMSLGFAGNFREIYKANDIMNRNFVSWVAYITTTACVIILVSKLQAASRFRHSLQIATNITSTQRDTNTFNLQTDQTNNDINSIAKIKKAPNSLSAKDLQVIKSVTLICVIFILSQLPFQIISTIRLLDPEFANLRKKKLVYGFASYISNTFGYLNASVNISVHFHFNARYRETFFSFFSKRSGKNT